MHATYIHIINLEQLFPIVTEMHISTQSKRTFVSRKGMICWIIISGAYLIEFM